MIASLLYVLAINAATLVVSSFSSYYAPDVLEVKFE